MRSFSFLSQAVLLLLYILMSPVQSFSPYTAAAMVHGMKGICADLVAQRQQWKQELSANGEDLEYDMNSNGLLVAKRRVVRQKIDFKRSAASLIYGALYNGVVLEHSYNRIYPMLFGPGGDMLSVLQKVSFNMLIQSPFLSLPAAYISNSFISGYSVREAFRKYFDDVLHNKLLLKYYSLWVPVMSFAFGVVPDHLRAPFCAMVSFFWTIFLSAISNKNE